MAQVVVHTRAGPQLICEHVDAIAMLAATKLKPGECWLVPVAQPLPPVKLKLVRGRKP